jgi:hypothetical protein
MEPDTGTTEPLEQSLPVKDDIYLTATLDDSWFEVAAASGENGKKELSFDISGNEWCIAWCVEGADPETGLFTLVINREDILTAPVRVYTGTGNVTADTLYFDEGNNHYQVKIIASNVDSGL